MSERNASSSSYAQRQEDALSVLQDGDDDVELGLMVSPRVAEYLDDLIGVGLFGGSREEVARELMARALQRLVRDRILRLRRRG